MAEIISRKDVVHHKIKNIYFYSYLISMRQTINCIKSNMNSLLYSVKLKVIYEYFTTSFVLYTIWCLLRWRANKILHLFRVMVLLGCTKLLLGTPHFGEPSVHCRKQRFSQSFLWLWIILCSYFLTVCHVCYFEAS